MSYSDSALQKAAQAAHYQKYKQTYIDRARRQKARYAALILAYKQNHPCVDCDEADPVVLEFDHRPGEIKLFDVGEGIRKRLDKVVAEIKKCDVRCANCHRRITAKRRLTKQN
jgi:hypothetical protein